MIRKILVGAGWVGLIGLGVVALLVILISKDLWYHPDLWFKKLDQRSRIDLDGLAHASVPPTFHREAGIVNSGARAYFNGETVPPAEHFDDRQATWRFVQAQHNDLGGHPTFPAILDVTLFRASLPESELLPVSSTSIGRFYSNTEATPPFGELTWTRVETVDGTETRALEREDPYTAGNPGRWLVIHVDPRRHARVDLYAWKSAYSLDEAWRLVRGVAATVEADSALEAHFASVLERREHEIRSYERELDARHPGE